MAILVRSASAVAACVAAMATLLHVPPWLGGREDSHPDHVPLQADNASDASDSPCCPCETQAPAALPPHVEALVLQTSRRPDLVAAGVVLVLCIVAVALWSWRWLVMWRFRRRCPKQVFATLVQRQLGPLESFSTSSLLALYSVWRGVATGSIALNHEAALLVRVAGFLLEPPAGGPHEESLECLPECSRQGYRLQWCTLGTPLMSKPLSVGMGNILTWKASSKKHLLVALPRGAYPWGLPSHQEVLAVWQGPGSKYLPDFPSGPPIIKVPVSQLTATDCHNGVVQLEFSFGYKFASRMRPNTLHRRAGALLTLCFEDSSDSMGKVAEFLRELHGASCAAGSTPVVVPGLPNRGGMVPSKYYCRRSREIAELLWGLLNIAFLWQPLVKLWRLDLAGLGFDGVLRLCVSRPGVALQPLLTIVAKIRTVYHAARLGDLRAAARLLARRLGRLRN